MDIYVAKNGGDYHTIKEAVEAVPYEIPSVIHVAAGIYEEKIVCEKKDITIIGESAENTILTFNEGALDIMPDGSKRGTFRTQTLFLAGERAVLKNITIRNTAGDGRIAGQAIALYADSDFVYAEDVTLQARQDTLFCAPLPFSERQKNGFLGPRMLTERKMTSQYYRHCKIVGDVDFIFGGANAVFDSCEIVCKDREHESFEVDVKDEVTAARAQRAEELLSKADDTDKDQIGQTDHFVNGYITAPCGLKTGTGFIFVDCFIHGEKGCQNGSVFLGRPWREEAKAAFIGCTYDKSISSYRFSGWGGITKDEPLTTFAEYEGRVIDNAESKVYDPDYKHNLEKVDMSLKNPWVYELSQEQAATLLKSCEQIKISVQ
ncbi:MAG: hypothetical protein K6A23_14170 [Butyrivibrio sp.]|nr:hypothetical protein [Butyrivibrio sp.]